VKTLGNLADRENISHRLSALLPDDAARWGSMSAHEMVCHLDDSYKVGLGERYASPATSFVQRTLVKWLALHMPMQWPKGVPTRPEMEQGKGGSPPFDFRQDVGVLLSTLDRFCDALPTPCALHPIFREMTAEDWMRWGYLHADHHLRQFGR
jgi:hypothetical protein